MATATRSWYWLIPKRWQFFHDLPWTRLWRFALAAFFLFTVVGFFNDLLRMGRTPYATVLLIAFLCGLNAVLWIVTVSRLPWPFVVLLIALQFVLGPMMARLANWMETMFSLSAPTPEHGVRFASTCILAMVIVSYWLFVNFFQVEGREMMRIRTQLELAHGIQKTLVPPVWLRTEHFEIYGISRPSEQVGGDLVDALELPGGDVIAYVADVAGHGLPAGILMGMLKTAARTALLDAATGAPQETLPALLEKLNRVLPDVKEPQMYATVTAFRLNADGQAWVAMAASPPVLHWHEGAAEARQMSHQQYPVGLLPVHGFRGEPLALAPGDMIAVATDGVLEVCNPAGEEFGMDRVQAAVAREPHGPLEAIADNLLKNTQAFGRQEDDQTVLLVRRVG